MTSIPVTTERYGDLATQSVIAATIWSDLTWLGVSVLAEEPNHDGVVVSWPEDCSPFWLPGRPWQSRMAYMPRAWA